MNSLNTRIPMIVTQFAAALSRRGMATQNNARKVGDISSVFVSLSGGSAAPLPPRFADIKRQLIRGNEEQVVAGWKSLLLELEEETQKVAKFGSDIIPQINFKDIHNAPQEVLADIKQRGVAVIRGVVPREEARAYKGEVEEYVRINPWTRAFPQHDPQVFELYWSPPQVKARSHENLLATQRFLMSLWHSNNRPAQISTSQPLSYADRVRIRQPGDTGFALGPHVDGGGVERWEPEGYGRGEVYNKIWQGKWQEHDAWEASCRVPTVTDLYAGAGACSMFRMFQGWLGMSETGPNEGTLKVNPLLRLSTAYFLLRPFFAPKNPARQLVSGQYSPEYLKSENWELIPDASMTSDLQGANPGHAQELNHILHPHLKLDQTMVHIPHINPGDYVVWHCDTIHSVDKVHQGKSDSSVMYIPVCPVTEANAEYILRQRDTFLAGLPGPDFPGGKGESEHTGRPTINYLQQHLSIDALRSMGFAKLDTSNPKLTDGEQGMLAKANEILAFN